MFPLMSIRKGGEMIKKVVKKIVKKVEKKVEHFVTTDAELAEKLQDEVNITGASEDDNGVKHFTFACTPEEAEKLLGGQIGDTISDK